MRAIHDYNSSAPCNLAGSMIMLICLLVVSASQVCAQKTRGASDPYFIPPISRAKDRPATSQSTDRQNSAFKFSVDKLKDRTDSKDSKSDQAEPNLSTSTGDTFENGRVLARVGGYPIFFGDIVVEAGQILERGGAGSWPADVKQAEKLKLIPRLLPKYIDSKLLFVDVKQGLPETANWEEIMESAGTQFDESVLPQVMKGAKLNTTAQLDAYFRAQGSSLRKFRRTWSENEIVKFVMRDKISVDTEISHREMYDYYLDNKDQLAIKAKVKWEQLMVRFDKFPTRSDAKKAIVEMGNEVVYGASFAAVAKNRSQGFEAASGGQQGWTTQRSLRDKNFDNILFTIPMNELSEIIETERGLHIVRVLERTANGYTPFAEAQVEIRKKLLEGKREAAFQEHIAEIRKRIPVEIYEPTLLADKEEPANLK